MLRMLLLPLKHIIFGQIFLQRAGGTTAGGIALGQALRTSRTSIVNTFPKKNP